MPGSSATRGLVVLGALALLADPAAAKSLDKYTWLLVVAAICAFAAAFGIGANDVANAFATSVGAKSISRRQAVVLACIFEFLGSVTLGSSVSETIRKGIADPVCFQDNPGLLMWGMTCVIISTGAWLIAATFYEMPVSTTHSCVGAIIGMTMMARDTGCVTWYEETDEFPFMKGVSAIVVSWVLSPFAAGICAAIIYAITHATVLRWGGDTSFRNAKFAFPVIVGFTCAVNVCFFILKGAKAKGDDIGTADMLAEAKEGDYSTVFMWSAISGAIMAFFTALGVPLMAKIADEKGRAVDEANAATAGTTSTDVESSKDGVAFHGQTPIVSKQNSAVVDYVNSELNKDPHAVLREDNTVGGIHERLHRHDARTEELFKYVQVFTAIVAAFSHGANDVANAMGPFAAIWMTWKTGMVATEKEDVGDDMYWILVIGGVGICAGLSIYGYKIMEAIGVKLTAITPSRGYCIELGAAFVVIYGTTQGWPLSTTHCQVGSTVGVGLFNGGSGGVNRKVLLKTLFGWVATLVVAGFTAAVLVGPSPEPEKSLYCA
eukprot:CAMPEP_0172617546 /NCGR_PEP_ID=MMETSP1068-20121228/70313_1 /TAXON_ID=35684 /ORGANISM="Pseudopedinella elastica, Strain CCMP716" /LENGTH=547 /DNA_ID=CAMNT_0013423321 /DNA_START=24 /DNA_END=1667 /DNA_ORIENTATION=+